MPTAAIEGEHLLPAEALAEWVSADEHLELADQVGVAAKLQVGIDPLLDAREVLLGEARAVLSRERLLELASGGPRRARALRRTPQPPRAGDPRRTPHVRVPGVSRTGAGRASGRRAHR